MPVCNLSLRSTSFLLMLQGTSCRVPCFHFDPLLTLTLSKAQVIILKCKFYYAVSWLTLIQNLQKKKKNPVFFVTFSVLLNFAQNIQPSLLELLRCSYRVNSSPHLTVQGPSLFKNFLEIK